VLFAAFGAGHAAVVLIYRRISICAGLRARPICSAACCVGNVDRWEGVRDTFPLRLAALDEACWHAEWVQALQTRVSVRTKTMATRIRSCDGARRDAAAYCRFTMGMW